MYRLLKNKKIKDFAIIGIGRRELSVADIITGSRKFISKPDASVLSSLENNISYLQGDLDDRNTYDALKKRLAGHAKKGLTNVLFYLAFIIYMCVLCCSNLFLTVYLVVCWLCVLSSFM